MSVNYENNNNETISILVEIPGSIKDAIAEYLDDHPGCDQDTLFIKALTYYLRNTSRSESREIQLTRVCLESLLES